MNDRPLIITGLQEKLRRIIKLVFPTGKLFTYYAIRTGFRHLGKGRKENMVRLEENIRGRVFRVDVNRMTHHSDLERLR